MCEFEKIKQKAQVDPVKIGKFINGMGVGDYEFYIYFYKGLYFMSEIDMTDEEFKLVYRSGFENRIDALSRELDRIKAKAEYEGTLRVAIPEDIQILVWTRDCGECVKCGSTENLEFDHIIPFSKGGSNSPRNLQLSCEQCHRSKGAKIGG